MVDIIGKPKPLRRHQMHTSNPSTIKHSIGGVGRNILEGLHKLNVETLMISAYANDGFSASILSFFDDRNLSKEGLKEVKEGKNTATYIATLDENGELVSAMANMDIFESI